MNEKTVIAILLSKSVLIPKIVDLLKQFGKAKIEQGNLMIELAELVEHSTPEKALEILNEWCKRT